MWSFVAWAGLLSQWPLAAAMSDTLIISLMTIWDLSRWDRNGFYRCGGDA